MQPDIQFQLTQLAKSLPPPFWKDPGFIFALAVGIAGLVFSILSWIAAKEAKKAATAAGRTVKLQTVAIELSEIGQRLDRVQPGIRFSEARDLLADTSRRLHRATSPFKQEPTLEPYVKAVIEQIDGALTSLKEVRPQEGKELEAPDSVYYGIEAECSSLNASVADLIGLLEKQAFDFGADNGKP